MDEDPNAPEGENDEIHAIVCEMLAMRQRWENRKADPGVLGPALTMEGLVILRNTVKNRKEFRAFVALMVKKAEREHAKRIAAATDVPRGPVH
jgi:hypothetical protein